MIIDIISVLSFIIALIGLPTVLYNIQNRIVRDTKVIAIAVITSKADIFVLCADKTKDYSTVEEHIDNMFEDFITPELRSIMEANELFIRRITQ